MLQKTDFLEGYFDIQRIFSKDTAMLRLLPEEEDNTKRKKLTEAMILKIENLFKEHTTCPVETVDPLFFLAHNLILLDRLAEGADYLSKALDITRGYKLKPFFINDYSREYLKLALVEEALAKKALAEKKHDRIVTHMQNYEKNLRFAAKDLLSAKLFLFYYLITDASKYAARQPWGHNNPGRFIVEAIGIGNELIAHTADELEIDAKFFDSIKKFVQESNDACAKTSADLNLFFDTTEKLISDPNVPPTDRTKILENIALLKSVVYMTVA